MFQPNILEGSYVNKSSEGVFLSSWKEKHRVKKCYNLTSNIYDKRYYEILDLRRVEHE